MFWAFSPPKYLWILFSLKHYFRSICLSQISLDPLLLKCRCSLIDVWLCLSGLSKIPLLKDPCSLLVLVSIHDVTMYVLGLFLCPYIYLKYLWILWTIYFQKHRPMVGCFSFWLLQNQQVHCRCLSFCASSKRHTTNVMFSILSVSLKYILHLGRVFCGSFFFPQILGS